MLVTPGKMFAVGATASSISKRNTSLNYSFDLLFFSHILPQLNLKHLEKGETELHVLLTKKAQQDHREQWRLHAHIHTNATVKDEFINEV